MSDVRGLTVIVAGADPARAHAAITLASAAAALGGRTCLYLHDAAVKVLADPALRELRIAAHELGVRTIACQSGLAAAGIDLRGVVPPAEAGGMVGLLATLGDDRLVFA
ncbi:hypothetical protein GO308_02035 [Sphingomonas sp. SFZ2018-12]|uniref:DsrE family protein n=1 Tax=Sphingomonas sp. SFZ2018-12 TaxID=2683197 RepID=UPI001F10AA31|nr:DsrE family protein [Sphingomonas sp. SFZ2018-12]MCH4891889.1 hypothetical protein [Sphingomonas sp. SFZ2018-12]